MLPKKRRNNPLGVDGPGKPLNEDAKPGESGRCKYVLDDGDLTGTVIGIQGIGFLRNYTRRLVIGNHHSLAQALFTLYYNVRALDTIWHVRAASAVS